MECVAPECAINMAENHSLDGEREEKRSKRRLWKWLTFYFLCSKSGRYNLAQAEKTHRRKFKKKTHVDPELSDGDSEKEKNTQRCCQWPVLRFPRRRATINDPVKAKFKSSKVSLSTSERQPEQDIQHNGLINSRYEMGEKLDEGGYGYVYAATCSSDRLKVAVKVAEKTPDMPYTKVHGYKKELSVEMDCEDKPDQYIMVSEQPKPCMDLFSLVKLRGGCLDEKTAQDIMRQVIQAANVCCKHGVFHQDIKLENLLLNLDTMEVKLIGCGDIKKRSAYKVMYDVDICPPEFRMKGRCNAKLATVWSLGILLFEMLCGDFPSIMDRHMISMILWRNPEVSKECCQMICECLHPNPKKRLKLKKMLLHDWFKACTCKKYSKDSEVPLSVDEKQPEQDVQDNASEVPVSTAERQPEQDVQDNDSKVPLSIDEKQPEQDVQDSVPLSTAEKQPEQDFQDNGLIESRYKIAEKLVEGGYGYVYATTRHSDGLKVDVKVAEKTPSMAYMKVHAYKKKLPVETGLTMIANKGSNIPQIIQLLDWEDKLEKYIMVLERPNPCMDLFSFMKLRGGCLNEKIARDIMQPAIQAANVCHKHGDFHRDIKLENLLLNPDTMDVKLIDFGCGDIKKRSAYRVTCAECCWMICGCLQLKPKKRLTLKKMLLHDLCNLNGQVRAAITHPDWQTDLDH